MKRKLILSLHVTPDGFCNHDTAVVGEDWMRYVNDLTTRMGTAVFGRTTFELFEAFWPKVAEERTPGGEMLRFADLIGDIEKIVFSRTLKTTGWNNTHIKEQLTKEAIDALKEENKGDIIVFGGPGIISELMVIDAFDEYQIAVQPMFAGAGYRLFTDVKRDKRPLQLMGTHQFDNGVVLLKYQPKN